MRTTASKGSGYKAIGATSASSSSCFRRFCSVAGDAGAGVTEGADVAAGAAGGDGSEVWAIAATGMSTRSASIARQSASRSYSPPVRTPSSRPPKSARSKECAVSEHPVSANKRATKRKSSFYRPPY